MVEGPGTKLKGEKMKAIAVGQVVKTVAGIAAMVPKYQNLVGLKVIDVRTLGKELFIFFQNNMCVRLHFLMDGFVRYNNELGSGIGRAEPKVSKTEAKFVLTLSNDLVSAYQCSVEMRPGEATLERWHNMITLDICWREFDAKRSAETILAEKNQNRIICDVIMDQEVMPGVGNIIKNEALFNAGIIPISPVKHLNPQLIAHLVKMTRDFSMIFYDCRKHSKALAKHYKMYMFSQCKDCKGRVTKCKPGEYKRGTYFCPTCQTNNIKRPRPTPNSLLGWIQVGGEKAPAWTCTTCTLENKPLAGNCLACGTAKNKRKSEEQVASGSSAKMMKFESEEEALRNMDVKDLIASGLAENKDSSILKENDNLPNNGDTHLCKTHKKPCRKRIVNNGKEENKGRQFWTCSTGRACKYFAWADLDHPKCKHGAITFLREVYKLNQNNGKSFYICPKQKKDQCDFFQWK